MTQHWTDDAGADLTQRYATFQTENGGLVVYDREDPSAWLESDLTVEPSV